MTTFAKTCIQTSREDKQTRNFAADQRRHTRRLKLTDCFPFAGYNICLITEPIACRNKCTDHFFKKLLKPNTLIALKRKLELLTFCVSQMQNINLAYYLHFSVNLICQKAQSQAKTQEQLQNTQGCLRNANVFTF